MSKVGHHATTFDALLAHSPRGTFTLPHLDHLTSLYKSL